MFRLLLFFSLLVGSLYSLSAQSGCPGCEISLPNDLAADTIYLSLAPDGEAGIPYDEDLSFRMPMTTNPVNAVDSITPAGLTITELHILGVVGLPTGLSWEASETVFPVAEQTDGCVKLCGTPFLPGMYEVEVILEAQIFFLTQQTSITFDLHILPAQTITEGFSIENNAACGSLTTHFTNNIPSNGNDGVSYFWDLGNGNTTTMETPNVQTYDQVGDYEVNYQAIIDTTGYFMTQVVIEETDCTDLFSNPDLKFDLFGPDGEHVFTSNITGNANLPITYDVFIPIGEGNYELHVIDDDGGLDGADDLCGIINFTRDLGGALSAGDLSVNINLVHPVDTIQSSETVYVYPIPEMPTLTVEGEMPYCDGNILELIVGNYSQNLTWSLDSLPNPFVSGDTLEIPENGEYMVFYTSENGCVSETNSQLIEISALPEAFVLQQDGNLIRIEDESVLPTSFSFNWYYEGMLISSATDLLLCTEAAGLYSLEIIDNTTGCGVEMMIEGSYDPNLDCTTSLDELNTEKEWRVYPNPFSSELNIESNLNKQTVFYLFDVLGRAVYSEQLESSNRRINIENLTNGMYLYKVQTLDGKTIKQGNLIKTE